MHGLNTAMNNSKPTKAEINRLKARQKVAMSKYNHGEALGRHMGFICAIILYDKFDFSMKKLENFQDVLLSLKKKWQDDNDNSVTNKTLYGYCMKKKIDVQEFTKTVPWSQKLYMADVKGRAAVGSEQFVAHSFMACMFLTVAVLKETYRFSNKKIEEFFQWVKTYMELYYTKEPGSKEHYCSDERIRQAFIEDEGWDIVKGVKVS